MKLILLFHGVAACFIAGCYLVPSAAGGAAIDAGLLKAKSEAEARGYIFETSRSDIVAKAKKEGRVKILSGWDADLYPLLKEAFRKKYPFIEVQIEETAGIDAAQRNMLEVKSGGARGWDLINNHPDFYADMAPHLKKFDILGMARHGILTVPLAMVDPVRRNVLEVGSQVQLLVYNRKLLPAERVPSTWEDLLKPEFKDKKFAVDMRPTQIASLIPAWGLEKTLDYARKLAAQQPIWVRGGERAVTNVMSGEFAIFIAPNYSTAKRAEAKDPAGVLGLKVLEPIPTRLSKSPGLIDVAEHPYAGLLWVEFEAGPEAQRIADKYEPYGGSIHSPGSALEELTRGKKVSVIDWDHFQKMKEYQEKIVAAYGFPKASR